MTSPEFSRPVRADTIGHAPRDMDVAANEEERAALARRFALTALDRLEAKLQLVRAEEDIVATGRITAEAVQACVATGEPVPARVDEPFELRFRPETAPGSPDDEVEIGEEELDILFYDGAMIDVGEAVAQTLALALPPYPRTEGAAAALKEAGVKDEGEAGPFGALAGLKDKLGKG